MELLLWQGGLLMDGAIYLTVSSVQVQDGKGPSSETTYGIRFDNKKERT